MTDIVKSRVFKYDGCDPIQIVLRHDPENGLHPYVVHTRVLSPDRGVFHISGDYCESLEEGAQAFGERATGELRRARRARAAA